MRSTVIGHPAYRSYTPKPHALDELARRGVVAAMVADLVETGVEYGDLFDVLGNP